VGNVRAILVGVGIPLKRKWTLQNALEIQIRPVSFMMIKIKNAESVNIYIF
jgi:hypothetical protein